MFNILNDMGFPRHIVALIQALYEKESAIVRITHQAFLHREGRTATMHSISTRVVPIRYPHDTLRIAILGSRYDTYVSRYLLNMD